MTALANKKQVESLTIKRIAVPIAAVKVWQGGMACIDTSAHVATNGAAANANLVRVGVWAETVDNSGGSSGGTTATMDLDHEISTVFFASATGANAVTAANSLFADVYILDDQTVTTASSGNSKAGRVWAVDSLSGVAVESYTL